MALRLAAAASVLALCVAVRVCASSPGAGSLFAAVSVPAALASLYSLDPGAGALLLPLCSWSCFSGVLSALMSRRRKEEEREGGDVIEGRSLAEVEEEAAAGGSGAENKAAAATDIGGSSMMNGGGAPAPRIPDAPAAVPSAAQTTATAAAATTTTPRPSSPPPPPPARPAARSDSLLPGSFGDPRAAGFRVRGPHYFTDRAKVEPEDTRCRLSAMELVSVPRPTPHIARFIPSIRDSTAAFTFVWQVLVPGRPLDISMVCAWELNYDPLQKVRDVVEGKRAARARRKRAKEKGGGKRGGGGKNGDDKDALSLLLPSSNRSSLAVELSGVSAEAGGLLLPSSPPSSADRAATGRRKNALAFTVGGHRRASTAAGAGDAEAAGDPFGFDAGERSGSGAVPALAPVSRKPTASLDDEGEGEAEEEGESGEEEENDLEGCDPFDLALARFIEAGRQEPGPQTDPLSVKERHARFKIIPRIEVGPW